MESREERRLRLFNLDPGFAVMVLNGFKDNQYMDLPVGRDPIPDDAEVSGVWWEDNRGCFVIAVWSPEYEPVPPGEQIPYHEDQGVECLDLSEYAIVKLSDVKVSYPPEAYEPFAQVTEVPDEWKIFYAECPALDNFPNDLSNYPAAKLDSEINALSLPKGDGWGISRIASKITEECFKRKISAVTQNQSMSEADRVQAVVEKYIEGNESAESEPKPDFSNSEFDFFFKGD